MGRRPGRLRRLAARPRDGRETRRAYGVDLASSREWAGAQRARARGAGPPRAAPVRRRARPSAARRRRRSRASWPRSAAFYRHLVERGELEANPADLVPRPKRDPYLPRVLKPDEVAELLESIPAIDAARAARPRDVRAGLRRRAARRGADQAGHGRRRLRRARRCACTARAAGRASSRSASTAWRALERYLERGRPALTAATWRTRPVPVEERAAPVDVRRAPPAQRWTRRAGRRAASRRTRCATRSPPTCWRGGGPAHDPGAPGPRVHQHDPDIHSGRVEAPQDGVRARSPARVTVKDQESGDERQGDRAKGPVAPVQGRRRREGARAARPRVLAAGQVRGRPHVERPARARRGVRPDLVRPARPDLGDRALRPRARDQVRDVRDHAHQGLDHRRAALARLGAALGARQGARDREDERQARAQAAPRADRPGDGGGARTSRWTSSRSRLLRDLELVGRRARRAVDGLRRLAATRCRCSTRFRTRTPPTRRRRWTRAR